MPRTETELDEWVSAYIDAYKQPDASGYEGPHGWAIDEFMATGVNHKSDIEDYWRAILAILARNPPERVPGMLAAGPLEDLIHSYGSDYIDEIETEAGRNPAFRQLLGGEWESSTPGIWARIEKARGDASS